MRRFMEWLLTKVMNLHNLFLQYHDQTSCEQNKVFMGIILHGYSELSCQIVFCQVICIWAFTDIQCVLLIWTSPTQEAVLTVNHNFYTYWIRTTVSCLHYSVNHNKWLCLFKQVVPNVLRVEGQRVSHSVDGNPDNKWNEAVVVVGDSDGNGYDVEVIYEEYLLKKGILEYVCPNQVIKETEGS